MKTYLLPLIIALFSLPLWAQYEEPYGNPNDERLPEWARMMYQDATDLEAVLAAFNTYYETHEFVKNGHTQYLKRLLRERETYAFQHINPDLTEEQRAAQLAAERSYLSAYQQQQQSRDANWVSIGPYDWDHDAAGRSYAPGAAHVYTIEQSLSDPNILFAGTATAGLWRSTDRGASWTNVTKDRMVNQVYAVEISPTDPNRVFASMERSIYASTDGGESWNPTGDANFQQQELATRDIKTVPDLASSVWAATDNGLYLSIDDGANWTQALSGNFQEIEFHPGNSAIIYVLRRNNDRTEFFRSTDAGQTFELQSGGWPVPPTGAENGRAEIAVTPAAPNKVYALLTGQVNGGSGLYGVYVSEDEGTNWTFMCCGNQPGGPASLDNINMMAWADDGTDDGGQYYYDLALAVSPVDADHVFVAGVNLWVSQDGGNTFTCPAKWSHSYKPNYVHADIHDINFYPNGDLWVANDGGIFRSVDDGANFQRSMLGITGSDFWGFGLGFNNDELMIGGAYHNGTLVKNGDVYINEWACIDGGDGVGGAVNPIREDQAYSNYNIKTMPNDRTVAPITRGYALEPSWTYITGRYSQIEFASDNYNVHFFGFENGLYKTEDDNRSVSLIYDFGEEVGDVEVSWTDPNVMYVATFPGYWSAKKLYRTTDGGLSWTEITPPVSSNVDTPFDVEVSYNDANTIWAARIGRGTNAMEKVFRSDDGGDSWTDISNSLLNSEVLTNIIAQRGTDDQLYVGTTRSVYHSTNGDANWELFADGLPASSRSRQLAISYRNGTLFNATNRSVWRADLAQPSAVTAQISVDKYYSGCARDTFRFADHSTAPLDANFEWSFPGASWVDDVNARNPRVLFSEAGTYDVSLSVNGVVQTLEDFVEVGGDCAPQAVADQALVCGGTNGHFISSGELAYNAGAMTIMAWVRPSGIQDDYTGLVMTDGPAAGMNLRINNELGYHWPGGSTHWAWSSGLSLAPDEWSFVVMVITPERLTMYLNELSVTRTYDTPIDPAYWSTFRIGSYQGWGSRNFRGQMDEVLIWDRALSRDEIRDWRHLTKHRQATPGDEMNDPNMLAYFQFNEFNGAVYDRVNNNHGILSTPATRVASTAPVGDGSSTRYMVNSAGEYDFADEDLSITFAEGAILPQSEVVVTRLTNAPNSVPDDVLPTPQYWIVNNYGNSSISPLASLEFSGLPEVDEGNATAPEQFVVYQRAANSDDFDWGAYTAQADAASADEGSLTFGLTEDIDQLGQFVLSADESLITDVDTPVNIDEQVRVYPNPLNDGQGLRIEHQLTDEATFELFTEEGRLLRRTQFTGSVYLRLPTLPSGVYPYRIVCGEEVSTGHLVKS